MADLLDSIQRDLRKRLDELRPLVREYERLQAAAQALGDRSANTPPRAARSPREAASQTRRPAKRKAAAGTRTSRAANREKVVALIGEWPGVTKTELKDATGLSGAGVAQNLRRLIASGQVREEPLPGGQVGYRLGDGDANAQAGDSGDEAPAGT